MGESEYVFLFQTSNKQIQVVKHWFQVPGWYIKKGYVSSGMLCVGLCFSNTIHQFLGSVWRICCSLHLKTNLTIRGYPRFLLWDAQFFSSCGEFLFFQFPEIKSTGSQLYPPSLTTVPLPLGPEPKTKLAPPKKRQGLWRTVSHSRDHAVVSRFHRDSKSLYSLRVFAEVFFLRGKNQEWTCTDRIRMGTVGREDVSFFVEVVWMLRDS